MNWVAKARRFLSALAAMYPNQHMAGWVSWRKYRFARQDVEREKSEGAVQTMNRVLGVEGLKLGVVRVSHDDAFRATSAPESAEEA